jgi:two-component system cell cycle sensor histidine kinase/response regulator CckA
MPDQDKDQLIKEDSKMPRPTVDATTVGPILSGYGAMILKLAPKDVLTGVILGCGTITALTGGLVLVGWVGDWGMLKSVRTDYIPMAPNSALLFILLGVALVVRGIWPANRIIRSSVQGAGLLTLIVTGMALIGSVSGLDLEIGHWLLPSTGTFRTAPVGRMSPISSFSFIFSGAALLLLGRQTRNPTGIMGAVAVFVGWVNVTGYCFGEVPLFYGGDVIPMALPTSLAFILLGAGLIAAAGSQSWPLSVFSGSLTRARLLRWLLPAILVITLIQGWLNAMLLGQSDTTTALGSAGISVVTVLAIFLLISRLSGVIGDKIDRAEQELRESEQKYRRLTDNMQDVIWQLTPDLVFTYVSPSDQKQRGYEAYEVLGRSVWEFMTPASQELARKKFAERMRDLAENKKFNNTVYQVEQIRKDGTTVWTELLSTPLFDSEGNLIAFQGVTRDITDRKRAEESLEAAGAFLNTILNAVPVPLFYKDKDGRYIGCNKSFEKFFGKMRQELVGKSVFDMTSGDLAEIYHAKDLELFHNPGVQVYDSQVKDSSGAVHDVVFHKSTFSDHEGHVLGLIGVILDITELTQARLRLEKERAHLRTLLQTIPDLIWLKNSDGIFVTCNARFERFLGAREAEIAGKTDYDFVDDDIADSFREHDRIAMAAGKPSINEEWLTFADDGHSELVETIKTPMYDSDGSLIGVLGVARDITAARKAEDTEKRLATAIEHAAEAVIITDATGIIQYVNPAQEILSGYSLDELVGQTPNVLKSVFHNGNLYKQIWDTIGVGKVWSRRFINKKKDGTEYHEDASISPVYDKSGNLTNFVVIEHDVTKQLALQEQLFQSQKMETIGTLTGGFAHDFNNLLQPIMGYTELLMMGRKEGDPEFDLFKKIYDAGKRGADLIKGLMMLSRKVEPEFHSVDLNHEILQIRKLLSQTIPKTIKIDLRLSEDLETVRADLSQIGQVLVNLGVNARDAMPDGGILTIKTANVQLDKEYCNTHLEAKPGSHVLLTVADTGKGMDKETVSHMFEPFFTTKEKGKGTGLGLSTVYGIVKKHEGHINCYSEPGNGTTFTIYFPSIQMEKDSDTPTDETPIPGGTETVLLADDEDDVRDLGAKLLNRFGYKVILAGNGKAALEIYQREGKSISLIILDLIMPEMDGRRCLAKVLHVNPNAKVIIASGYSESAPAAMAAGAKGFVQKPYNVRQFLNTVREILDEG